LYEDYYIGLPSTQDKFELTLGIWLEYIAIIVLLIRKMKTDEDLAYPRLKKIGVVQSILKRIEDCPLQGTEGAPDAWLNLSDNFIDGLDGLKVGDTVVLLTWFHLANRETLKCYPRREVHAAHVGVFSTRSPDRPNPIGLHTVKILSIEPGRLKVYPLEALDGTLLLDIKPMLAVDFRELS
jgi:tRNA-Thr(GGU) m(6)t(6)A37 methyltransferase TsaA